MKNKDKRFQKFLNYFLKNWFNNKSYNFNRISNENFKRRTNNICESFHRTLNNQISHYHPKIAYLTDKLKIYAREAFKKHNSVMVGNNIINNDQNNIANDIIKSISNFHEKYYQKLDIETLIPKLDDEKNKVTNICKDFLNLIFIDDENYF